MHNPALPVQKVEPVNSGLFKVHDRVRIKAGTFRKSEWVNEMIGCGGVLEHAYGRPYNPYKIKGINMWFHEDELEKIHNLEGLKDIPVKHRDVPSSYTGLIRHVTPAVEYVDIKSFAEAV